MKINTTPLLLISFFVAFIIGEGNVLAQIENKRGLQKSSEIPEIKSPITKEMEDKVIETVKPVIEKIEMMLKEDKSGSYASYSADVQKLNYLSNIEEKKRAVDKIQKRYYSFIKSIWLKAGIDEKDYRFRIKSIFPPYMRETIQFTEFLNFSIVHNNPNPLPPPPPPPPALPDNICLDALTLFFNTSESTKAVNANASVLSSNNYIRTGCGTAIAGYTNAKGAILSNIKIPGTFPGDAKKLRISKNYVWRANASAVSILGSSFATIATTAGFDSWDTFITTWAPVIFVSSITKNEVRNTQILVTKDLFLKIRTGIVAFSSCYAAVAAGSFADSVCDSFTWSVCEEQ